MYGSAVTFTFVREPCSVGGGSNLYEEPNAMQGMYDAFPRYLDAIVEYPNIYLPLLAANEGTAIRLVSIEETEETHSILPITNWNWRRAFVKLLHSSVCAVVTAPQNSKTCSRSFG